MKLKKLLIGSGLGLTLLGMAACSTTNPTPPIPNINLSKANVTAECLDTTNNAANEWIDCTVLNQATFVCNDLSTGNPVDVQIVTLINAFSTDPVLQLADSAGVSVANALMMNWCLTEGYLTVTPTK